MKLQIERKYLLLGLQQVFGVVEKRSTMPILSHILISAYGADTENGKEAGVSIFATDLEISIQDCYPAHVITPGQLTCPAKKLLEIVRELPEGMVKIELQENYWISIEAGNAYFKIAGLPHDDFPALSFVGGEGDTKVSIAPDSFSRLIRKTAFATGENDQRYILNGLLIEMHKVAEAKHMIRLVATDGQRLALAEEAVKSHQGASMEERAIVPKKAILEIKRLLDETPVKQGIVNSSEGIVTSSVPLKEAEITFGKNLLTLQYDTARLSSRLLNGNYPNYNQVIPKENNKNVSANKEALLGALARVSILSDEKTFRVQTTVKAGQIEFRAKNSIIGEASESVATSFEGEPFTAFFSARSLRELLLVIDDDEIVLEFKEAETACLVREKSGRFLSIFMPLRD